MSQGESAQIIEHLLTNAQQVGLESQPGEKIDIMYSVQGKVVLA